VGGVRPERLIQRLILCVLLAMLLVAACTSSPPPSPTIGPGGQPTVVIESPASGSPTPVGQPLAVQARADDIQGSGVNRIDLRVNDILVDSESTPGLVAQTMFVAQLSWTPSADEVVTLTVIAYRPDGTPSPPASVTVAVVFGDASPQPGDTFTPQPSPSPTAGEVPSAPPVTPTAAARPTLPPFATPTASPSPSPSPSPTPVAIDLDVSVEESTLDDPWVVGSEYSFDVIVSNEGSQPAPAASIRVRICASPPEPCNPSGSFNTESSPLNPGTALDYPASVTPQLDGERYLRVRLILPPGYVDIDPSNNEFLYAITVEPAASPTESLSPGP